MVALIISYGFKRKVWEPIFLFFLWKLCWPCNNAVCKPSHRTAVEELVYHLKDERRYVSFCLAFFLSLVVLFCCAFSMLVQEPSRNNPILHFKSLLKHRRSYLFCDNVGLLLPVSWLWIARLFISAGFTTSLISSLLSLTKVLSSTLQEKYFWSKQMGTWLPLLSMCTVCCTLDGWLAGIPASSLLEILYCYTSCSWLLRFYMFIK